MYDRLLNLAYSARAERELKQDATKFWEEPPQTSMWKPCADRKISKGKPRNSTKFILVSANGGLNQQRVAEVLGNHVDQKGSIVLPEKLRFDFSHGKPVKPEELRKIEYIVDEQIKAELDVYSKEATLSDAKRVYPDPVRVVAIGSKVEELLANTREAEAFALLSKEGIAKGIRRVTAVTTGCSFKAIELASALEQEVDESSKTEGDLLEQSALDPTKSEVHHPITVHRRRSRLRRFESLF